MLGGSRLLSISAAVATSQSDVVTDLGDAARPAAFHSSLAALKPIILALHAYCIFCILHIYCTYHIEQCISVMLSDWQHYVQVWLHWRPSFGSVRALPCMNKVGKSNDVSLLWYATVLPMPSRSHANR